jgi:hypothetical protein
MSANFYRLKISRPKPWAASYAGMDSGKAKTGIEGLEGEEK